MKQSGRLLLLVLSFSSVQFNSVAQSCPTLCDPMKCNTPGLLVHNNSWHLPKHMSIESVMPCNHLILCRPISSCLQSFPASVQFVSVTQLFNIDSDVGTGQSSHAHVLTVCVCHDMVLTVGQSPQQEDEGGENSYTPEYSHKANSTYDSVVEYGCVSHWVADSHV